MPRVSRFSVDAPFVTTSGWALQRSIVELKPLWWLDDLE